MIKAIDYLRAKENLERNYVLNEDQLRAWNAMQIKPKLCGYKGCMKELGPRFDGEHQKIGNVPVCDDCYFDSMGEETEPFPVLVPRSRRGAA